jgi:cytochrome c oxidase subunit IV
MSFAKGQGAGADEYSGSLTKIMIIYGCIVLLAALQFVVAYQHLDGRATFLRMFLIAIVEAGLAVTFFMHMGSEDRKFAFSVAILVIFVLATMQYGWTDSFRMERGVPGSSYSGGQSSEK